MEAKVTYITKHLGKSLENEKTFPLLLLYNYNEVIKPRCELLREKLNHFELEHVIPVSDEEFCKNFNIKIELLEKKKAERPVKEEKDILWAYVPGV
jgi:hypothetical protein